MAPKIVRNSNVSIINSLNVNFLLSNGWIGVSDVFKIYLIVKFYTPNEELIIYVILPNATKKLKIIIKKYKYAQIKWSFFNINKLTYKYP